MPQAGHVGRPLAFGYRVPVGAEGGVGFGGRQREPEVVHVAVQGAVHRKPRVGEPPQHEPVLGQRLRGEDTDPPATGQRDHMLQQQHADAALVHVIGDRHGDLRGPGVLIATLKGAAADHFAVQEGQQRRVVRRGLPADPAGFLLGRELAGAEEPQIQVVRGHAGVHVPHRVVVLLPRGPDLDRGAVSQQGISDLIAGPCPAGHVGPLPDCSTRSLQLPVITLGQGAVNGGL